MAVSSKVLIPSKLAEIAQTTQYTATGVKATIDKFTATNTSVNDATLSVNLVASGDTAGTGNLIVDTRTIAPGESYTCPELVGHNLDIGGFISTASSANVITIRASGREIS